MLTTEELKTISLIATLAPRRSDYLARSVPEMHVVA